MKIALVHKRLDRKGGTEIDFYRTAEGLSERGHQIHLFCSEYRVPPPAGAIAHRVPALPAGRTARLWSFALLAPAIIRRSGCDLVISFGRTVRQDVVRSGGGAHKVFLERMGRAGGRWRRAWQRVSPYHRSLLWLEKRQFHPDNFSAVIAVSEAVRGELVEAYGIPRERIFVLYNGVDHQRFHPGLRDRWRQALRREWGVPETAKVVLFVGSGFRRKGVDRLMRIWDLPELRDHHLVIVGRDSQLGAYRSWAERQSPGKILFVGGHDDVAPFYGAADLLVLPSVQEAFGNVVLEALAAGLPVAVSRAVGAAELLEGVLADGIVDDPNRASELCETIARMLERSSDAETGRQARRIAERYSWERFFTRLDACLKQVQPLAARG